jgi:hypothetical protein
MMNQIHWQPGISLEEVEKQVILAALKFFQQNRTKAAESLGISTRTIQNKLNYYNGVKDESDSLSSEERVHSESTAMDTKKQSVSLRKRN